MDKKYCGTLINLFEEGVNSMAGYHVKIKGATVPCLDKGSRGLTEETDFSEFLFQAGICRCDRPASELVIITLSAHTETVPCLDNGLAVL